MSTVVEMLPSKPIEIPRANNQSYKEIIKQLAAQTGPKPYGDIPPMLKKRKKKRRQIRKPIRRMSHVEDWIQVDSKESLPDEEELVQSPFRNFLFQDFITQVLPLHVPPPSLSEVYNNQQRQEEESDITTDIFSDEDDEDEDEGDFLSWKSEEDEEEEDVGSSSSSSQDQLQQQQQQQQQDLLRRHSISSLKKASSTATTVSYAISSSPPHLSNPNHQVWQETIQRLKKSLIISPPTKPTAPIHTLVVKKEQQVKKRKLIPMPPPPKKPLLSKRRSEATTQPRFNPLTNTYTRDTRSNPDHLRMISAELNMMRQKKLLSPLKPRGFLPRRKDAFVRGDKRKTSHLNMEW